MSLKKYGVLIAIHGNIMVEYGYINNGGYLVSKQMSDKVESYRDEETGEIIRKTISVNEQLSFLDESWKPVDNLDENKTVCESGYFIRIIPYDAGERISFKYEKVFDRKFIKNEIKRLKERLSSTESDIGDYKITKCYEASLAGKPLPYDIIALREERQGVRDRINELEETLSNN